MTNIYTPTPEKVVTSIALDKDVRKWVDKKIPKQQRSRFFNHIARQYIQDVEKSEAGKEQATA